MTKKKLNVGILFGGKSAEHQISLRSAKNVVAALDRKKYRPVLIGIDPCGHWHLYDHQEFIHHSDDMKLIKPGDKGEAVTLTPQSGGQLTVLSGRDFKQSIDVIFPLLHGPLGEDGTVQGLLKLADIPFVGSGVLGSAIGMDKHICKRLLRDAGIETADFIALDHHDEVPDFEQVCARLGSPFFVKPASQGSSVGVAKVSSAEQYEQAVESAFDYDNTILLEHYVEGREIQCAVLGNRHPRASVLGEILCDHEYYSYQAKYVDEHGTSLQIPAKMTMKLAAKVQALALETFRALCCKGLARIDFFITKDERIVVNEVSTMPGFTSISMFPRLWQASGICYSALINRLILLALEQFDYDNRPKTRLAAA